MANNRIIQLKSYDQQTGTETGNVLPITNSEAVKVENDKNLKQKLTEINKQIEQANASLNNIVHKIKEVNVVVDLKCDNTGTIDCTSTIQDFIEENKVNGVKLYFPQGIYKHMGLKLYSKISIEGEHPVSTILKNYSSVNDSLSILGSGYYWPEEYSIKNITITSEAILNDRRKAINNYINRNFIYENIKIRRHKYGLFELGSWYSEHNFLDIQDCEYGIYIPYYNIPGTPNSYEKCIIRACDYNVFIGAGSDVLNFNGGHIGGANINQVVIDSTDPGNSRNIRFESVNFEGGRGEKDIIIGKNNGNGYIHNIVFDNCRFAQWDLIDSKIGIDIEYGAEYISLKDCYFIGYDTCVRSNSSFKNKELIMINCGKTNCTNAFEVKSTKFAKFTPLCGVTRDKAFNITDNFSSDNISSLITTNVGTQYKNCKKDGNVITISIRTDSTNITSGTIIANVDESLLPSINVVSSCVGLNGSGSAVQAYGQVI